MNELGITPLLPFAGSGLSTFGDTVMLNNVIIPTTTTPNTKQKIKSIVEGGILFIRCNLYKHNIPNVPLFFTPNIIWNSDCFGSVSFNCI